MTDTRENHAPSNDRAFHWEALPLEEMAKALQSLALARLDFLLEKSEDPGIDVYQAFLPQKRPHAQVFPGMKSFPFERTEAKGIVRMGTAIRSLLRDKPILAWHRFRLKRRRKPAEMGKHWRPLLNHTLSKSITPQARGRLMTLLLAHRFFGKRPFHLPAHLWRTAGRLAFTEGQFRLIVARKIKAYLRTRVMLEPTSLPPIRIDTNTFWLLLALHQVPRPSFLTRVFTTWSHLDRARQSLAYEAQLQARSTAWAGYWDQWLLLHALQKQPDGLTALDPTFQRALPALPLLASTTLSWPAVKHENDTPELVLAAASWKEPGPGWLYQLYESTMWEVATDV